MKRLLITMILILLVGFAMEIGTTRSQSPVNTIRSENSQVSPPMAVAEPDVPVEQPSTLSYLLMGGVLTLLIIFAAGVFFYLNKQVTSYTDESIEDIEAGRSVFVKKFDQGFTRDKRNNKVMVVHE